MRAPFVSSLSSSLSQSFRDRLRAARLLLGLAAICLCVPASGQDSSKAVLQTPLPLITQAVDESQVTVLKGNTHPLARPQFDLGTAPATLPMQRMLLVLKRSDAQEAALRKLLDDQQDKNSPNYHKWMTPEQFGAQFGPTDVDMQTITSWLQSHGFEVAEQSKGRTVLEFSGSASQVQEAFHTTIHKYIVNGEQHWANASDPSIPTALAPAVAGILSLHNFPAEAYHHDLGVFSRSKATGEVTSLKPLFTFPTANNGCGVQGSPCYAVGPYDFAKIYDVLPLWQGATAIDGTGQTIAIVAETDINTQDVTDFRNFFGLPAPNLQVIHNGPPPGIVSDETESDLDVEWSGAVAKGATIDFVVSSSTDTTFGVALSAQYIVDTNLAPVMSMSYGLCELGAGTAGNQFFSQLWQQASAQGITAIVSSGDSGAAGCDPHGATAPAPAQFGLAVTGWGESPYNVSVGGTDFFDLTDQATYWSATNSATTQASALSYIPEATWNNSCTNSVFGDLLGFSSNAETNCNDPQLIFFVSTDGGSGGLSNCTTNDGQTVASCSGGYAKPSWQTGNPNSQRAIPDVSLFAAAGSPSGSFYIICEADAVTSGSSCNPSDPNTNFFGVGGTSASAPAFAGIMALVNQKMALLGKSGRQGNANYVLYQMATQQPTAFHDVTHGTIRMPCLTGTTSDCDTAILGDQFGVRAGYDAATGYDLATGLGSVDANVMVGAWNSVVGSYRATTTTLSLSSNSITHGSSDTVNITVAPSSGTGTPTGLVSLIANVGLPPTNQTGVQQFTLDNTGKVSLPTSLLPGGGGAYTVFARYVGDGSFAASDSTPYTLTVNAESSTTVLTAQTFALSGNFVSLVPLGTGTSYGNLVYLRADVSGASKNGFPTGSVNFNDASGDPTIPGNPYSLNGGTNQNPGVSSAITTQGLFTLPVGQYSVTANYGSDHSFNASASSPMAFTITPAATATAPVAPSAFSISVGSSITLTANISTGTATLPSFGAAPGGTVSFYSNGTIIGTPQPVVGTAGTGTFTGVFSGLGINPSSATATLTTTALPTGSDTITAVYNGDGNYAASPASSGVVVNVLPPDFSISAPAITVTQGQSQTVTVTVTGQAGFNGVVGSFTCSGLPAETTCGAANPATVTGSGTTSLTITTTPLGQKRTMRRAANDARKTGWIGIAMLSLFGMCLIGLPIRRSRKAALVGTMMLVMLMLPSCGGGGTKTPPNPVPSISSLSPTQQAAGSQSQTVTINGSGFISGSTVTYNGVAHAATYTSGSQLSLNLSSSDMSTTGTFPVVVTNPAPGGGSSSPTGFNVVTGTPVGTFNVTVTATGPSTTHTATFAVTVQ